MAPTETNVSINDMRHNRIFNSKTKIYFTTIISIVALIILGNILSPGFASAGSVINLLALAFVLALAAIGQTLIIVSGNGGLDLSIDSMISMGALMGAIFSGVHADNLVGAIFGLVAVGGIIGLANGVAIRFSKVPPFVFTMAMATVVRGLIIAFTSGQPSGGTPEPLLQLAIGNIWGPIRWMVIFGIAITIIVELLLHKTRYGKGLFMVGSNRRAALLSGVNINFIIIMTYVIAGITSTLSGFVLLGVVGSATITIGDGYTLMTIAAVVIGGTQLSGGKGSFVGTVLGSILMMVLSSVLLAVNISSGMRTLIQGAILLVIIVLYTREQKLRQ
jgi:ribose transport system permease protein